VVGADALNIDYKTSVMTTNGKVVREGDWLTLDGSEGVVYTGEMPLVVPQLPKSYDVLMKWVDETRRLGVRHQRGHAAGFA